MNTKQQIEALQQEIQKIQGTTGQPVPEALQRQLRALQNELQNFRVRAAPRGPRIAWVNPTPPDIPLKGPIEIGVWTTFFHFHTALTQYSGSKHLNEQAWLRLADIAADLTAAAYGGSMSNGTFVEEAPSGSPQPYARNGATQSWVPTVAGAPPAGSTGAYGFNAQTGLWVPVMAATGVTDGSSAASGMVGECIQTSTSPGSISILVQNGTSPTITYTPAVTVTLTAGDWDITGFVGFQAPVSGGAPNMISDWLFCNAGVSPGGAILFQPMWKDVVGTGAGAGVTGLVPQTTYTLPTIRINLTTTQQTSASVAITDLFGNDVGKTASCWGYLHARRMR